MEDVEKLAFAITSELAIETKTVHDRNGQYMLTISKSQLSKVIDLVSPYMHPSILYKLGLNSETVSFNYKKNLDGI
jgi:hypothetical protein